MKKLLLIAVILMQACSPQVYSLMLDVRQPSVSGVDLEHKSMALVTMETPDSLFDRNVVSVMAGVLEQDYFGGKETIGIYRIPAADTVSLGTMHNLVMETGADVIFVMNSVIDLPDTTAMKLPMRTTLSVYDSMGKDKVLTFKGSTLFLPEQYAEGFPQEAERVGSRIASRFVSQWKTESFSLYYFEDINAAKWESALSYASAGSFAKAIDIWAEFAASGTEIKRAAACYDIAMAFYLLEDPLMASRWLDQADALENLTLSSGLRKRINIRLEK